MYYQDEHCNQRSGIYLIFIILQNIVINILVYTSVYIP